MLGPEVLGLGEPKRPEELGLKCHQGRGPGAGFPCVTSGQLLYLDRGWGTEGVGGAEAEEERGLLAVHVAVSACVVTTWPGLF